MYFELFGLKVETLEDEDVADDNIDAKMEEKASELTASTILGNLSPKYTISGNVHPDKRQFVNDNFGLIEQGYESHQRKDLRSLQMQGQKVFPDILRSLRIESSSLNEQKQIGIHDTGIFTSKFITFALQQLEFENRESRLS